MGGEDKFDLWKQWLPNDGRQLFRPLVMDCPKIPNLGGFLNACASAAKNEALVKLVKNPAMQVAVEEYGQLLAAQKARQAQPL
eukprot:8993583-Pyramimonas_sp.AAC.1